MKYFIEPFRYSAISQVYNGSNNKKIEDIISDLDNINKKIKTSQYQQAQKTKTSEITSGHKWIISVVLGILFFILASPLFIDITSSIIGSLHKKSSSLATLFINTLIFILFVRIILM